MPPARHFRCFYSASPLHIAFEFLDDRYRTLRFRYGSRATFFQEFSTLLNWALFANWDHLIDVMFGKLRVDTG